VGLAEAAALCGVVGSFFSTGLLIYAVGLVFALLGLMWISPTRGDIERGNERSRRLALRSPSRTR
jgi:hypothetical protein